MKKIVRVILIAAGALIVFLSVRGLMDVPFYQNVLGSAVCLEEPVALPENEGKMVVVTGKVEMTKPAYDEELGLTIDAVKALRYDEEYVMTEEKDGNRKYDWAARGSKTIVGEAVMGEFALDAKLIESFTTDVFYSDFDAQEISAYETGYADHSESGERLYVLDGAAHYYDAFEYSKSGAFHEENRAAAQEREGAKAYSYKAHDAARHEVVTIAGMQQGNTLFAHEKLGSVVSDGEVSPKALADVMTGALVGGSVVFMAIGLVLIFLGVRKPKKKAK